MRMVCNQKAEPGEQAHSRRTEGERQRRRSIADAAVGVAVTEPGRPKVERFRCVIYLCCAVAYTAQLREECGVSAAAFGWDVVSVIQEDEGQRSPRERAGLTAAIARIKSGDAGAIVTAWRSMISPMAEEYREIVREIEAAEGFVFARRLAPVEGTAESPFGEADR